MNRTSIPRAAGWLIAALIALAGAAPAAPEEKTPAPPGPVESPFLGLQTEPKTPGDPKSALVVSYVFPLSAAKEMGFQLGDELRTFNDTLITDQKSFFDLIRRENVNAKLRFTIVRGGQEMRIEGRIGSRQKTMKAYQDSLRKDLVGKPLPALPALLWWNREKKDFQEDPRGTDVMKSRLTVVTSFDDCATCKEQRYQRLNQMKTLLAPTAPGAPLEFVGLFFDERPGKTGREENLKTARALFESVPPQYPVAVAFYAGDKPTAADRDRQFLIHNHGTAIVDEKGNLEYVEVIGEPGQEFAVAYQKALQRVTTSKKP